MLDETVGNTSSDAKLKSKKSKRSDKKDKRLRQGVMDDYLKKTGSAKETPNKDRQKNIDAKGRSPPTPAEGLNVKKNRIESSESE